MKTTAKELAVLIAIAESEYRDGQPLDAPVWSGSRSNRGSPGTTHLCAVGVSRRGMGGVFASLQKKGLISIQDYDRVSSCVSLTESGIAAYQASKS